MESKLKKKITNILVFGCSGLLGKCLIDYYQYKKNIKIHAAINKKKINNKNLRFVNSKKKNFIKSYIKKNCIDIIINFAALTNIEICEKNISLSKKSNYTLPVNLAKFSKELNLKYVFISTDNFKFKAKKLSENSKTESLNIYSIHKKKAENEILKINPKSLIIRTNFYCFGDKERQSFSDIILNSVKSNNEIRLFKDVYYTPIYGKFLLKYLFSLIRKKKYGIFNICSNEKITKYKFGHKICDNFDLNKKFIKVNYLKSRKDFVKRPLNMALDNNKLKKTLKIKIPSINHQIQVMKKDFINKDNIDKDQEKVVNKLITLEEQINS